MPANGKADAPLTLIEISDYHCPFCRRHIQQTQPKIYSDLVNTGKLRHVFVHYPIAQLHPDADRSHEAAGCANDQGKFWDLHTKLFETPLKTAEQLIGLAAECRPGRGRVPRLSRIGQAREGSAGLASSALRR